MPIAIKYALYKNSDSEWLGEIPSSWPMVLLSQIVTQVKNKNSTLSEKNLLSLSYGRIKRKPIDTSGGLLPASFDGYNIIEANDIVLRLTDLQNDHTSLRVGLSQERGIITSAYTTMRPKNSRGAKYLYYLLHTFDIRKGFYGMGSGVRQGLNYDEVKRLKLPLPTEEEQIAIAEFLDRKIAYIDSVIAEAKASIEEYKRWKQAIIDEAILGYDDIHIKLRQLGTLKNGINFSHSEATPNIKFLGVGCFKDSMVLDSIDNFADEHIDFTVGDDYLRGVVFQSVFAGKLFADRLFEGGQTCRSDIFGVARVHCVLGCLNDVFGGDEVGFADAEVDDLFARRLHFGRLCRHGKGHGGRNFAHSFGKFYHV